MSASVSAQEYDAVVAENRALAARMAALGNALDAAQRRIDWFTRELFGSKSEKRLEIDPAVQPSLFAGLIEDTPAPRPTETVEITRRKKTRDGAVNDTGLCFDETVPVRVIEITPPAGFEDGEVIATHSTFRLAQRRASYEVLEYRCPVIKTPESPKPQTTPVCRGVYPSFCNLV